MTVGEDVGTEIRHVTQGGGMYWCGVEFTSGDLVVTADGALFRLKRNDEGVCEACLRAMVEFIGEHIDEVPAEQPADAVNMTDNLARLSLMRLAELIAAPLRDLYAELHKQLDAINWNELHRESNRAELAIRNFRDVVQICDIIYGAEKRDSVTEQEKPHDR